MLFHSTCKCCDLFFSSAPCHYVVIIISRRHAKSLIALHADKKIEDFCERETSKKHFERFLWLALLDERSLWLSRVQLKMMRSFLLWIFLIDLLVFVIVIAIFFSLKVKLRILFEIALFQLFKPEFWWQHFFPILFNVFPTF